MKKSDSQTHGAAEKPQLDTPTPGLRHIFGFTAPFCVNLQTVSSLVDVSDFTD